MSVCPSTHSKLEGRFTSVRRNTTRSRITAQSTSSDLSFAFELGIKTSLAPTDFNGLRGMAALQRIEKEATICSVPRSSSIVLTPKMKNPCPDLVTSDYWNSPGLPFYAKMALMLLHQCQTQGSKLQAYTRILPSSVDLPVFWSDKQLQLLAYPNLVLQVQQQKEEWKTLYSNLVSKGLVNKDFISKEKFFWALSIIRSRTFSGPFIQSTLQARLRLAVLIAALALLNTQLGSVPIENNLAAASAVFAFNLIYEIVLSQSAKQYSLCPIIDLINHSSRVSSEVSYDYWSDSFSVSPSTQYDKGTQVFINYGQNNDGLLQYYGFVETDNEKDAYIMTSLLQRLQSDPKVIIEASRLDDLNSASLLSPLQTVSIARNGVPSDTLQALRFLLSSDIKGGPASFSSPGAPDLEQKVAGALSRALASELDSLGSTVEEDEAILDRDRGFSIERTAVQFRVEKKKVLLACLLKLGGAPVTRKKK